MKNEINPLVSIIIPAYNVESYIADAIESVLIQDYQNWEMIIVDDGSTDTTSIIIQKYLEQDKRIYCYRIPNNGVTAARNYALGKARGELIAFLDADDIWMPQKLSISISEFLNNNQDLLYTSIYKFHETNELLDHDSRNKLVQEIHNEAIFIGQNGISKFIYTNRIPVSSTIIKREILLKVGGFGLNLNDNYTKIGEDYCLWLKLLLNGYSIRSILPILTAYRLRPTSAMHSIIDESQEVLNIFVELSYQYPEILKYKLSLRPWLRRFIRFRLNSQNVELLKFYCKHFGFQRKFYIFLFAIQKIIPFCVFKYFIIHFLKKKNL